MDERLEETLFQINKAVKRRGLPDLSTEQIKTMVDVVTQHGMPEQVDPEMIAEQVVQALQGSAEGGLVNDARGQATGQMRGQLGFAQAPAMPGQVPNQRRY